jgi:hypothetical protein
MKTTRLVVIGLGVFLIFFPLAAPIILGGIYFVQNGHFMVDYLMPAELFPAGLVGALLLLLVAWGTKTKFRIILWIFLVGILLLVGSQAYAVVSGLASGEAPFSGLNQAIVLGMLALFVVCQFVLGVLGIQMFVKLRQKDKSID